MGSAFAMLFGSNCAHKDSTTCNYLHGWEQLMVPISKNGINKAYLKMILYGEFTQKRNCLLHNLLTLISFRINFFPSVHHKRKRQDIHLNLFCIMKVNSDQGLSNSNSDKKKCLNIKTKLCFNVTILMRLV